VSVSQIIFALLGLGLIGGAMTYTKQYFLMGTALGCWVLIVVAQFFFGGSGT